MLACCPTLNVVLKNDVKEQKGQYEGVYTYQGLNDGMDYWIDAEGEHAIWYRAHNNWNINKLELLGTPYAEIYGSIDTVEKKCPNNEGYVRSWYYWYTINGYWTWKATNDISIKCTNEDDFCTSQNPCGIDQGDCDIHDECQDGLLCGSNNCPGHLGFHSEFDCCYAPTCCLTLNVLLENGLLDEWDNIEGSYKFQGSEWNSNGIDYWVNADGEYAIWYIESSWIIAPLDYLGSLIAIIVSSSNMLENNCPNNEGYVWNWFYADMTTNSFVATNDVYIKCSNENDFCTTVTPCESDQGDCDTDDECQDGLLCGSNNCPDYLGLHIEFDCCYANSKKSQSSNQSIFNSLEKREISNAYKIPKIRKFNNQFSIPTTTSSLSEDYEYQYECYYDDVYYDDDYYDDDLEYYEDYLTPPPPPLHTTDRINFDYVTEKSMVFSKLKYKLELSTMSTSRKLPFELEQEMMSDILLYSILLKHKRNRKSKLLNINLLASKQNLRKSSSTKSSGPTQLKKTHHASSDFGLTVVLNPKAPEYSNALKNSFTGFKTLVHTPYDFAEVDAVGMAIDQNIRAYIGIRGHHSWTTDAANAMDLKDKRCLARTDDLTKYPDIRLDIFANYTKKGCILECYANLYYDYCKCIPYHYPDFTKAWHVNSTTCDYNGLRCLSTVERK